jgi:hypothetical protein
MFRLGHGGRTARHALSPKPRSQYRWRRAADLLHVEIWSKTPSTVLSQNHDNGQWYLDLKKTEDYDAIIDKRAESHGYSTGPLLLRSA